MTHCLVICTRNRPDDLRETLESCASQGSIEDFAVRVVDASDTEAASRNASTIAEIPRINCEHVLYRGEPSLARQRNFAIEEYTGNYDIIHFLDDDVTLDSEYLKVMDNAFRQNPAAAGIGGLVVEDGRRPQDARSLLLTCFRLYSPRPGKVLASGHESPAQSEELSEVVGVEWLNGCSAYRSSVLRDFRCDAQLRGYSLDEDLDLSYRISRQHLLLVEPSAQMVHRKSPADREPGTQYYSDYIVHRFWFVRKNIRHPMRYPAFWWSVVGRLLRAQSARKHGHHEMRNGYLDGIKRIVSGDHYLLGGRENETF
ncbi:MAG: glycosyltransferase family 2 protein [Rhodothermales bacterium]|nr:glycosyltransferase family 2 protein [Rhodothermales bacterium]